MKLKKILLLDCTMDGQALGSWPMRRSLTNQSHFALETRRVPDGDTPLVFNDYSALAITGSKASCVNLESWNKDLFRALDHFTQNKKPILGICYGMQLLVRFLEGDQITRSSPTPEYGWADLEITQKGSILDSACNGASTRVFCSHQEEVDSRLKYFQNFASTDRCRVQFIQGKDAPFFGTQFHPERTLEEGIIVQKVIQEKFKEETNALKREGILKSAAPEAKAYEKFQKQFFEAFFKVLEK